MPTIELEQGAPIGLEAAPPAPPVRHEPSPLPNEQPILSIRASVPRADAGRFISEALHDIRAFMQEHHVRPAGPPFANCRARGNEVDIEAGWPTTTAKLAGTSRIHAGSLPRGLTRPPHRPERHAPPHLDFRAGT